MEAYRIERFGSVDGIVLRSSQDPRPGGPGCFTGEMARAFRQGI